MMTLTRNQKKESVINLYEEGKTTREIAKIVRISLQDIGIILREHYKEPGPEPTKSKRAKSFQMFHKEKTLLKF
jgi:transposase